MKLQSKTPEKIPDFQKGNQVISHAISFHLEFGFTIFYPLP